MFTGIVEEIGTVQNILKENGACRLSIKSQEIIKELYIDDSISINGVCLTVVAVSQSRFDVEAVEETLMKTTLKRTKPGAKVNLERALTFAGRLGGHVVQGHVDSIGKVTDIKSQPGGTLLSVSVPKEKMKYVISEGSITVNGVSLTVARINNNIITISLIPHTLKKTTLSQLKISDEVNIEVDIIGKYVENLLQKSAEHKFSESWLKQFGY